MPAELRQPAAMAAAAAVGACPCRSWGPPAGIVAPKALAPRAVSRAALRGAAMLAAHRPADTAAPCRREEPVLRTAGSPHAAIPAHSLQQDDRAEPVSAQMSCEEMNTSFSCEGVDFVAAAGLNIARLRLANGCTAKLLVDSGQVTSYNAKMWHGGVEEVLFAAESNGADGSPVVGGMLASCPESGGVTIGRLRQNGSQGARNGRWRVSEASSGQGEWARVSPVSLRSVVAR